MQPYGNPGSLGEPLGLVVGRAALTGDGSAGVVQLVWRVTNIIDNPTLPDFRRRYVLFIDALRMTADGDPGNWSVQLATHMARANAALTPPFDWFHSGVALTDGITFSPSTPILDPRISRFPIFWDTEEFQAGASLTLAVQQFGTNTNLQVYTFGIFGRYYDRAILGNRGFGRLVAPEAVSQFEG